MTTADSLMPKDLMDLFSAQSGTTYVLWNLYALVALGIVGLVQKTESSPREIETEMILSFGFVCFGVANLLTILQAVRIQRAVIEAPRNLNLPLEHAAIPRSFTVFPPFGGIDFHLVLDVFVLLAIWLANLRR
jgi:hypothetical protein